MSERSRTESKIIFLTGMPGVGKTTILQQLYWDYKRKGYRIGGILTREVRENNMRIGFRLMDLQTGHEGWLARIDLGKGPRVGRYNVSTDDLDAIGSHALETALDESVHLVLVDEIGPMEMSSPRFEKTLVTLLENQVKPVVASIKQGMNHPIVERVLKTQPSLRPIELRPENREDVLRDLLQKIGTWLADPAQEVTRTPHIAVNRAL